MQIAQGKPEIGNNKLHRSKDLYTDPNPPLTPGPIQPLSPHQEQVTLDTYKGRIEGWLL